MIASRMNRTRHRRPGREHGLPTAAFPAAMAAAKGESSRWTG